MFNLFCGIFLPSFSQIAASIMKYLLSLSSSSPDSDSLNSTVGPEVFLPQLKDSLPQGLSLTDSDLEQYLMILTEDEVSTHDVFYQHIFILFYLHIFMSCLFYSL